ncbi:hypothetical protein SAMN04489712_101148 [Thermomonospora echinospora]|uniref:Uncharacterized protein n=1 Tax=Thermomonospora echinospora TaxID=1992 RepID=A0A1H5SDH6_9ACTN|nr:hypothetical protein [Thermomonospora echinospora]SEF48038.1 hypothetical protein SAMN04489712_101148 [Thermomonospora echinospora]
MSASMRNGPAAGDPEFRGIDPDALGHLLKQMNAANRAIIGWLDAHPPPAGVPATGHQRAQEVSVWVAEQLGMLNRRYNYAITHPDTGGGIRTGPAVPPRPAIPGTGGQGGGSGLGDGVAPPRSPRTTPKGAGDDLGTFPNRQDAQKAARADAFVINRALKEGRPIPDEVWRRLGQHADDPDYTEELYDRLGPAGIADLIRRAAGDEARLRAISESLGTASFHLPMNAAWLKALLAEADRDGTRDITVRVLLDADMSRRTDDALARLGLLPGGAAPQAPGGPARTPAPVQPGADRPAL